MAEIKYNKEYVLKIGNKREKEYLKREYFNYLKLKKECSSFLVPEPLEFNEKNIYIKTKLIKGVNLENIFDEKIFRKFGKNLREFHEKGFSHGELEVQDILYDPKKDKFYIFDVAFLNEKEKIRDVARFIISLYIRIIKKPWRIVKYRTLIDSFLKGYGINKSILEDDIIKEIEDIIKVYKSQGCVGTIKAYILKIIILNLKMYKWC